ncbi:MAG: hypothetical protein HYY52_07510 [Candidatus Melainabacteria bacterium]|nr:hypothetical protein [Candidatus Melainabacteria bacterium]
MMSIKIVVRIIVWTFTVLCIAFSIFLYYFSDLNKLKDAVEKNLRNQLTCTVKLGDLSWDWDGLKLGVSTSNISIYDQENNLVLQGGPTRFVWHFKNLITQDYSHFYSIDSSNLYLNAIRDTDKKWNIIKMFPPGPPPKADNLRLHNSIIYLIDELNPTSKMVLYKDLNLIFEKPIFSKLRKIDLTTRIGSFTGPSFLRIKGRYTERDKFNWKKSEVNLFINARKINIENLHGYFASLIKEPEIKKIKGEITGIFLIKKNKNEKTIKLRTKTNTNKFVIEFKNKDTLQTIEIPKTDLLVRAHINQNTIQLNSFKSNIDELTYKLKGTITHWREALPEGSIELKTNKFNFKTIKPYLPLSLLPASTRQRIEPINDEGYVTLDLNLKGPLIAPKYYGAILLEDFNLTAESGFLNVIKGLDGKLILDDELLKIDYLNIPIEGYPLILKGEVNNETSKTKFNLSGKNLSLSPIKNLLLQTGFQLELLSQLETSGKLDLNLDVTTLKDLPPEIKGIFSFQNAALRLLKEEPIEVKNIFGELLLDGKNLILNKFSGLLNNEKFSIQGGFSLKEDEKVNLLVQADKLKIVTSILTFITAKTPFKPIAETTSGEASNLNLNISGTFSHPALDGMLLINNVAFSLPNLQDKISNLTGSLKFEGTELIIEELTGKVQNSDFAIAGYIENLFSTPKPKLRLVTQDIEISNFWNYLKEGLKTTSLSAQTEALEKLKGIAAIDIFLQSETIFGNVYFKNAEIKYKSLPFGLNNLAGRLVVGEKNLSLFDLMGTINTSNNFNSNLTVYNYLDPSFNIQGQLNLDLDLLDGLKAINAAALNTIKVDGLIPTFVNFDLNSSLAKVYFYSILDEMLGLTLEPYINKPIDKSYTISGNARFDTKDMNLYLDGINLKSQKLSLTTDGSIKNISSSNPELMLHFASDEPCGVFMIIEPITPLMGYKIWGMIELEGLISGTPSMYHVKTNATVTDIRIPELLGKKLTSTDGSVSILLDNDKGTVTTIINNIKYVSLDAKSLSLALDYLNPQVELKELSLDEDPGSIFATGLYDPRDGAIKFNANGSNLELASLGSFIFLDSTKISGTTNFSLMIDSKGKTKQELITNTTGNVSLSISDGKLGQVALLQKGIQLANLFKQGLFGFNLTNIFSLFFKYQDGSFNKIKGDLDISSGIIKAKELIYRAKDLLINSYGFIDLNKSFINLSFYGHLPESEERTGEPANRRKEEPAQVKSKGALSIIPEALGKKRFFIPFLSLSPPEYFKFEVKGDIKKQKRITSHARRSFKWLKGKKLQKEYRFVPK